MPEDQNDSPELEPLSSADAAEVLHELRVERALATGTPLRTLRPYMDDLEAEIAAVEQLYVLAAVTEIAVERAGEHRRLEG